MIRTPAAYLLNVRSIRARPENSQGTEAGRMTASLSSELLWYQHLTVALVLRGGRAIRHIMIGETSRGLRANAVAWPR